MVNTIIQRFGRIDLLVNNAAISVTGLFTEISKVKRIVFDVNVKGTLNCSKAVLPYMIRRKSGKIINIASMWGGRYLVRCIIQPLKLLLLAFTKALAKEVGPSGIQVNCISPGVIMTDMNKHLSDDELYELKYESPLERLGAPEDIANAVCFLASDKANFITGQVLGVNGGFVI